MIRVAIADDQTLVRAGLAMILGAQDDIEVVAEAENGEQAIEAAHQHCPDVILMDIRMPLVDGLEATRQLTRTRAETPRILVLTTFDTDEYVYEALRAGASGFLLKTTPPHRLVEAVRLVATGEALLAPNITRRLIETYVRRPPPGSHRQTELQTLTDRELEIFRLVAQGKSNAEIAASLVLSEATVKTHLNRTFSKLALRDRVQAVVLAYESGLVQPGGAGQ